MRHARGFMTSQTLPVRYMRAIMIMTDCFAALVSWFPLSANVASA